MPPRFRPGAEALLPPALRAEVDAYLASRQPAGFLAALRQRLLLPAHEVHLCGTKYNVPLLNALVFYVGVQARPSPCCWHLLIGRVADLESKAVASLHAVAVGEHAVMCPWSVVAVQFCAQQHQPYIVHKQ